MGLVHSKHENQSYSRRLYQRGIRLLEHPHFLLLHIPAGNSGAKMQLVKLANNPYHRKRILQRINIEDDVLPYYALSHLWGISKTQPSMWDIGGYVDDINGEPAAPVSMRPEKCQTLITLLQKHPDSYWWIDVLCARSDTPLAMMSDIYGCCHQCYAMIDCKPEIISKVDWMAQLLKQMKIGHRTVAQYNEAVDILNTFTKTSWWKRVWTWQEVALPKKVILMAESLAEASSSHAILNIEAVIYLYRDLVLWGSYGIAGIPKTSELPEDLCFIIKEISESREIISHVRASSTGICAIQLKWLFELFSSSSRQCMDPVDYVYGVLGIFEFDIPRMTDPKEVWMLFLREIDDHLAKNLQQRKFIYKVSSDHACQLDLLAAKTMGDVYRCLFRELNDNYFRHCNIPYE